MIREKHFNEMPKKTEVDEYALKEMVGHNIKDITESNLHCKGYGMVEKDLAKMQ